jgi:hypothetical protein
MKFSNFLTNEKIYKPDEIETMLELTITLETQHCYRKKVEYFNIPCSFDIETSSFYNEKSEKTSIMYAWMLGINGLCMLGRTWVEFENVIMHISNYLKLNENKRLIIYVHNLSYEFQFLRKHFEWFKVFAISSRKPAQAITEKGIEFRCSYILSGYSLEKVGEHLQKYKVNKLVGDLDYSKIRNSETPLTKKEIDYCINDIKVVMSYIQECIENDEGINNIPLTKTGYVRKLVKNRCFYGAETHAKSKTKTKANYKKFINHLTITPETYKQMKRAFQGGFTHANAYHVNRICNDVASYDFTSSYPSVMLSEKFPMSKGENVERFKDVEEFESTLKNYCCVFDVRFINLKPKIDYENYISRSRCWAVKKVIENNGRVVSAEELCTTITEQDYFIIKLFYSWDNMGVANFKKFYKGYLPKPIILSVLELYQNKTKLKGVKGKEVEYLSSKEMINSVYGMMVTDIVREDNIYNDDWERATPNLYAAITTYNKDYNRFLFYPWGVWVTAYARRNLFTGIIECKDDYVYSDTDSIKLFNKEKHKEYFDKYNDIMSKKLIKMCEHYHIEKSLLTPETSNGVCKPVGVWDYEGTYNRFKTLGAKRYITEKDNIIEITVSGLNKKVTTPYLKEKYNDEIFNKFENGLYVPKGKTGKNTHTYIDDVRSGYIRDYLGNESSYEELSSVHLESADYSLGLSNNFISYIHSLTLRGGCHEKQIL